MNDNDIKRISRLTAILTQLQTKRILTATELAKKFAVSTRTIYRDIRTLEQSGVPIITQEGKGYSIMAHYTLPPIAFTEDEAMALITTEQIIMKNKDASFVNAYSEAVSKIKAILRHNLKDKTNLLFERVYFAENELIERTSNQLITIQSALTNYQLISIVYKDESNKKTNRLIEPFALLSTQEKWMLIAWCRLRNSFRFFRLDRIEKSFVLSEKFEPHKLTLQEYFEKYH